MPFYYEIMFKVFFKMTNNVPTPFSVLTFETKWNQEIPTRSKVCSNFSLDSITLLFLLKLLSLFFFYKREKKTFFFITKPRRFVKTSEKKLVFIIENCQMLWTKWKLFFYFFSKDNLSKPFFLWSLASRKQGKHFVKKSGNNSAKLWYMKFLSFL